ncbi:MAG: DUF3575 domain-containing protein [Prolixibacteraceae bacterium]|jgi:hypothetical protein|nr:DUF3575 domain-containing protein [Prolixibacteraceae bacterium]MBT6007582.1 DUF3575 domain-containing protein [Prolixibacteraceae bacterium]MBT6766195.1 DUF3575 domain-containing protein [Prolixibacteraceae bacterium]MBT6999610.1 DUF3575 domain-containing protein [Prolixibacteraceae bacterium]MBT7395449.1 DUF3575 domain-containing protein [Prolixibacteraceae bacterium]
MLRLKNILFAVLILVSTFVIAQENVIKVGFTDALLGNFKLSYERVINDQNSIQFKIGYWQPTMSPFIKEQTITPEAYTLLDTKGGVSTSIEYRFFLGKSRAPQGLYIAPYLRYFNQSGMYSDVIGGDTFDVDARLNTFGLGAQIGYQLVIEEVFTIDFYFFGAGLDKYNLKLKYELQQPQTGFDYNTITDDVSEVFENINYLENKLNHEVNTNNLTSKLPFLFPGFRIGISVGFAF